MFLSIYNNQSGDEYLRRLAPNEHLDLRRYVTQWAAQYDCVPVFSEPGNHIPNGCADWQAELRETKRASAVCWISEPFYLESESES